MNDLKDRIWDVMRRNEERDDALDLERAKAEIRQWSYALKWTGTPDELTATITKWYESGWIVAESLQDALQMASIHFVKPDGMPVIRPLAAALEEDTAEIFTPSPNYQKLTFRGKEYDLTKHSHAPRILKVLHESANNGELGMTTSQIRKKAKLQDNGKMYDWFRETGLWRHLVIRVGKDRYRLDIPIKS